VLTPNPENRRNSVAVICDECGHCQIETCDYERVRSGSFLPREGQVKKRLAPKGWSFWRDRAACPTCTKKKKERKPVTTAPPTSKPALQPVAATAPLREPNRDQKRLIVLALEDAYDTQAGRYKGAETDKTLAVSLGPGILPGWVSAIREEFFGPAGNSETDAIRAEIEGLQKYLDATKAEIGDRLSALTRRLDACVASHDKRIGGK
jgi:hypothetical protein